MLGLLRKVALVFAVGAVVAAVEGKASAQTTECTGSIVSTCIQSDTLWPHAGPQRFVGVGGADTVARDQVGFALVATYLSRPIVLHIPSPGPNGSDQYAIDDQVNGNFLFAYGVTDRFELDFALPVTFGQGGTGVGPITGGRSVQDTAMRDMRFGLAYAILPRERIAPDAALGNTRLHAPRFFALTARFELSAPTGDRDQFAGERAPVWLPSLAADFRQGRLFAGLEVGARVRPVTELVGTRIGTQGSIALGVGFDLIKREILTAMLEARALPTLAEQHEARQTSNGLDSQGNGKHIFPAEWMLSLRTAPLFGGDLAFQVGGGGTIPTEGASVMTTPRFRFMLGINFAPLGRDTDKDGVLDKDDKCPREPAEPGAKGVRDGCTH